MISSSLPHITVVYDARGSAIATGAMVGGSAVIGVSELTAMPPIPHEQHFHEVPDRQLPLLLEAVPLVLAAGGVAILQRWRYRRRPP